MRSGALRLRETPKPAWLRQTREETDAPAQDSAGASVRCAACGARLARPEDACERAGDHRHRLTNPAGVTFDVLLFAAADGCEGRGPATREHSWFPPARWTLAHCRGCGVQVGWRFAEPGPGAAPSFVGLMAERIRVEKSGHAH